MEVENDEKINVFITLLKEYLTNKSHEKKEKIVQLFQNNPNSRIIQNIRDLFEVTEKKIIPYNWIEERIDELNDVMLNYAQHNYTENITLKQDDLFDSLSLSIKYLGETLNDTTVSKEYLQDIFNSMGDFLIVTDNNKFITFVNQYTLNISGFKFEELIGKPKHLLLQIDNTQASSLVMGTILLKNSNIIPVAITTKDFLSGDNDHIGYVTIAKDMSSEIQYQKELQDTYIKLINAKEKAEESDRLKTAFLTNMSHEIRTPLNGILGFSELLINPKYDVNTKNEFLSYIKKSGRDLISVVNDIIDISMIESNQINIVEREVDVNSLLKEIFELHQLINEKDTIAFQYSTGLEQEKCSILTDDQRLKQIINCLLNNAFKFTERGSISFGYKLEKDYLKFFVSDTGIGISKNDQNIVFNRFAQAKDISSQCYRGTGLGLAISKSLVELLRGTIWIESQQGLGSTFYFTIPYKQVPNENLDINLIDINDYNWENKTILIVEDTEINLKLLQEMLFMTKANLLYAINGEDAVEMCKKHAIDIVLMDIYMPIMNGFEATKQIKLFKPDLPIIAQTANAISEDKNKCLELGCSDYIAKPFSIEFLFQIIQKYF